MANLTRKDYEFLFKIGSDLYEGDLSPKTAGTMLMAMSEYVIGQQAPWPTIHKKFRHLTTYTPQKTFQTNNVIPLKRG